ncbi:MAG: hypothetical protein WDM92_10495 [Caulobacteraceae bacterium]
MGAALGLAFLAKYAAVYFLIGVAVHAAVDREARRAWRDGAWAVGLAALLIVLGPNLAWLAGHGFATVAHTATVNARWSGARLFNPGKLLEFALGQFGVLGPIPFGVLIAGTVLAVRRKALAPADRMLLCFVLPPLLLVTAEAFISRAHAHWAAAGYGAACVLAAAWLVRWRARRWTVATLGLQGLIAALVVTAVAWPGLIDALGQGRRLQRVRGWATTASLTTAAARRERAHDGLTAVAVEDRYLFNELAYYARLFRRAGRRARCGCGRRRGR